MPAIIQASMTLEVQLSDSDALALRQRAESVGQDLSAYVGAVLRREASRAPRTLEQIAGDIEKRRGGPLNMSEDEITDMLEIAKHEMRAERHQRTAQ